MATIWLCSNSEVYNYHRKWMFQTLISFKVNVLGSTGSLWMWHVPFNSGREKTCWWEGTWTSTARRKRWSSTDCDWELWQFEFHAKVYLFFEKSYCVMNTFLESENSLLSAAASAERNLAGKSFCTNIWTNLVPIRAQPLYRCPFFHHVHHVLLKFISHGWLASIL